MHFSGFVRRGIRAGLFFILLLTLSTVRAAEPVWNNLNWDMSIADVKKLYPKATESTPEAGKTLIGIGEVEVEGMPLNGGVAFDSEGKMRAMIFWVTADKWVDDNKASILQDKFFEKYGTPAVDEDERDKRRAKWITNSGAVYMLYVFSNPKDPFTKKEVKGMFYLEFQPPGADAAAEPKKE